MNSINIRRALLMIEKSIRQCVRANLVKGNLAKDNFESTIIKIIEASSQFTKCEIEYKTKQQINVKILPKNASNWITIEVTIGPHED